MTSLDVDPSARVLVFIDGQNLYKRCKELFGHSLCHPHLLAQLLAGPRQANHVRTRFYSGRPDPNRDPMGARNLDRRFDGMRKNGVTVVHRTLRYQWEWAPEPGLPRPGPNSQPTQTTMRAWQRPREKGIDLVLGLDVVEFVLSDVCDVVIVVSLDRDLYEIPQALRGLKKHIQRPIRVEAAVPVGEREKNVKTLPGFAYTHQISRTMFELARDDTDYRVPDDQWVPPLIPTTVPARPPLNAPTLPLANPTIQCSDHERSRVMRRWFVGGPIVVGLRLGSWRGGGVQRRGLQGRGCGRYASGGSCGSPWRGRDDRGGRCWR